MKKVRVGYIGWLSYDQTTYAMPYAVCDVNRDKIDAFLRKHPDMKAFTDYREMAEDPSLDVVVISTPNWLHCEMTELFLQKGKHVFCEKPMGVNRDEMNRMLIAQRESGKMLAIDFEMRHSSGPRRIKNIIESGELGTVHGIEFIHHRGAWLAKGNGVWRTDPEKSGGLYFMEPCHEVDFFRYLLGEVTHVQSFRMKNTLPQYPDNMPDNMYSFFFFECGAMATISTSHKLSVGASPSGDYEGQGHDMSFTVYGDKGSLRFNCVANTLLVVQNTPYPQGSHGQRVELNRIETLAGNTHHDIQGNRLAFLQACAKGEEHIQDAYDAWRTHCVCLAAEKSALEQFQRVEVDYTQPC